MSNLNSLFILHIGDVSTHGAQLRARSGVVGVCKAGLGYTEATTGGTFTPQQAHSGTPWVHTHSMCRINSELKLLTQLRHHDTAQPPEIVEKHEKYSEKVPIMNFVKSSGF